MNIQEIIQIVKTNHISSKITALEKSHIFLKKFLSDSTSHNKKELYNTAIARANSLAIKKAGVRFIAASLLFDLPNLDKKIWKKIRREVDEEIELLVKCNDYVLQVFPLPENLAVYNHVFNTALKLSELHIDVASMCTALLHEIPIQTKITTKEIRKKFTNQIADLIEKYQKLHELQSAKSAKFVNNLRELALAMAQDLRVIIIKMCSNYENMVNEKNPPQVLKESAIESMEILAPIADLLGIWRLRWQLEDYAFKILKPTEYERIAKRFNVDEKKNREKYIFKTKALLEKKAKEAGIACTVEGRFKHFYSIYQKMKYKNRTFSEISDVFALRVIVNTTDDCYRVLGVIHGLWPPKQRRMKDFISAPKENSYQSLHTTVTGINNKPTEFQIRTKDMDKTAKFGVASHWNYKHKSANPTWIQELLIKQQKYKDDDAFFSSFISDIIQKRIYVYSPKGDVIALPSGATPVDFAYHIHSEVGHKCKSAIVNDVPVTLDYKLNSNDIIQIITDRKQLGPDAKWLNFIQSQTAKKHISDFLNKTTPQDPINL
jgi:GTP diphosphokinase / guanosine-3',5'-bis(diphosphate) 3'-diphosphatase